MSVVTGWWPIDCKLSFSKYIVDVVHFESKITMLLVYMHRASVCFPDFSFQLFSQEPAKASTTRKDQLEMKNKKKDGDSKEGGDNEQDEGRGRGKGRGRGRGKGAGRGGRGKKMKWNQATQKQPHRKDRQLTSQRVSVTGAPRQKKINKTGQLGALKMLGTRAGLTIGMLRVGHGIVRRGGTHSAALTS